MLTYYVTIVLVSILSIAAEKRDFAHEQIVSSELVHHTSATKFCFILVAAILIVVGGLRYSVGGDYWAYYRNGESYVLSLADSIKDLNEPGIRVLYSIVRVFSKQNIAPMFVFQLFTIGIMLRIIYRYTDRLFLATLLFVFLGCWHSSFNAVRQCLAGAIVFCGMPYLREKRFWKYAVVVFIAFLFHRSAIVMIAVYFVCNNKISFKNIFLLTIGTVVVLFSYDTLFSFTEFIMQDSLEGDASYANRAVNVLRVLVAIVPAIYSLAIYRNKEKGANETFFINMTIINAITMVMASRSAMLARVTIYTAPFVAISVPELDKVLKKNDRITIETIMVGLYAVYFFYEIYNGETLNPFVWYPL